MSDIQDNGPNGYAELRFELAWRWFALHAKQRVSMFHFFLIAAGFLANAFALLVRENLTEQAAWLGFSTALVSGAFVLLDRRNRELVHVGEDLLAQFEFKHLQTRQVSMPASETQTLESVFRKEKDGKPIFLMKSWFLIEGTEMIGFASFLSGGIWALAK